MGTCYKIVPKVTSAYDFEKYGDAIDWRLERENGMEVVGGTDGMACLTAGATYYLVLTCRDGILENVPYSFSGKAVKAVTDLQVVSVPQVSSWVLDGQMPRWKGLVVEIMYEDGTSQRKDFSDYIPPRWEGVDDGYGNETYINAWKSDKNENFVTVEVYCGDYYASFEIAIEAGENEITRTVTEGINNLTANKNLVRDSVLFTPEKTMIYQVLVQIEGEYCENVEIEAESSSASYENRHCLAAGKTCMITFTYPKVIDTDAPLVVSVIPDGKTAISHAQITLLGAENLAYTGSELRPGVKVTLDGQTLTEGKDYSISYRNNVNAGNAMVVVKGMGDYAGSREASFKIHPMALNEANVGQISDQSYTGRAVCPEPSVMLGGKALKKGEDYTLSYQNNIQAGTASVTITGKGNYTGSIVRNFTIRSVPTNQEVQTPQKEQQISKLKVNAKMIPLKIKQSTSKVKITGLAKGDRIVSWTSSKPKVASVSKKGKITGRKMGTAVITVRTANGQKISFKVKVQKKKVTTSSVKLNKKKLQLKKGKSFKLTAAVKPITSVQKVTFTSNNKKVATVSKNGKIKARRKGRAVITVRSGKKKTVCRVNVK